MCLLFLLRSACIMSTNLPLTTASHISKFKINGLPKCVTTTLVGTLYCSMTKGVEWIRAIIPSTPVWILFACWALGSFSLQIMSFSAENVLDCLLIIYFPFLCSVWSSFYWVLNLNMPLNFIFSPVFHLCPFILLCGRFLQL